MPLSTSHAAGETILASDIDAIATQVNTNTTDIANRLKLDGSNLTDGGAALRSAIGVSEVKIQTTGMTTLGLFVQGSDPDTTNPGLADATDSALWFYPA